MSRDDPNAICKNCSWWDRLNEERGICKYHPPTVVDARGDRHPGAKNSNWCSKFKRAKDSEARK